ncbi:uncharacterized protein J4E84_009202, partial [Alternaria hordeiaustralica]|uniref:uncharacterized protein n=1 Tax=Alternaria hordeiaustralica TaxID=1187925 RepID=UPI0020C4B3C9
CYDLDVDILAILLPRDRTCTYALSMARFADLPTELELQIASHLSSKDLASYARIGKVQAKVAREHLYSAPTIEQPMRGIG